MTALTLDGTATAATIKTELTARVAALAAEVEAAVGYHAAAS